MKLLLCVFLMATIALFIPHIEAVKVDRSAQTLIDSICIETEDYEFCNKIIHKSLNAPTASLHELTDRIILLAMGHASDTYTFIGNILRELSGPDEDTIGLKICLAVYNRETNVFIEIHNEFSQRDYERMVKAILSTTNILKKCRTDLWIHLNKENPLIEKNKVMRILITMSFVSGYMVKNAKHFLISSVVTATQISQ